MNDNFFDDPNDGSFQTSRLEFLRLDYSALKTPESFAAAAANPETIAASVEGCKLGFHYYDKAEGVRKSVQNIQFVVLESYSVISGMTGPDNDKVNWWSNRVKDSRTEQFKVFAAGNKSPQFSGKYSEIKGSLPAGVGFHIHLICYSITQGELVEMKLTSGLSRAIKNAMAEAGRRVGKNMKADSISLFAIADTDMWGFAFKDFARETKEGEPYTGRGELYHVPIFAAGIVTPARSAELYNKCRDLQTQIRAQYAADKQRYSAPQAEADPAPTTAAQYDPLFPTSNEAKPASNAAQIAVPTGLEGDDLPF